MTTNVIVKLAVEGLHNWPDAKTHIPEVAFLSDLHRHVFHITAKKQVLHDDRDVEFIMFKRDITEFLNNLFYSHDYRCLLFEARSCEMIAREIMDKFDCCYVSVFEDNENGAEIIK